MNLELLSSRFWVALLLLLSSLPVGGQVDLPTKESASGRIVNAGPEFDLFKRVIERLEGQSRFDFPRDVRKLLVDRHEINAWADPYSRTIVVTTAMVRFLSHAEGELACVIAHEMGHIVDRGCRPSGQPSSGLDEILGAIVGGGKGREVARGEKTCEARADEIALQFAAGAGYNPYDCAAVFGRMMMLQGEPGLLGRFLYASTHPWSSERIMDLRRTLKRYCERFPDSCK